MVAQNGGSVRAEDARAHAEAEYEAFDRRRREERRRSADETISELVRGAKDLPKTPKR